MKNATVLEKIADSVITQGGLAAVASSIGTPLAALLPVLAGTLAASRHKSRVEGAIGEIEKVLEAHQDRLDALTDAQYKFINEIVLTVLQNTEDEKAEYLRRAILAGLEDRDMGHTLAAQVSRALRDLTAGELAFILEHSEKSILIGPLTGDLEPGVFVIDRHTDDMVYVSGLMGLGVIVPAGSMIDDGGKYVFAGFCRTLKEFIEHQ